MSGPEEEKGRRSSRLPSRKKVALGVVLSIIAGGAAGSVYRKDNQINDQVVIDCSKTPGESAKTPVSLLEPVRLGGDSNLFGTFYGGVVLSMGTDGSMLAEPDVDSPTVMISPDKDTVVANGITIRPNDSIRFTDGDRRYNVEPIKDADELYSSAEVEIFCLNKPQPTTT